MFKAADVFRGPSLHPAGAPAGRFSPRLPSILVLALAFALGSSASVAQVLNMSHDLVTLGPRQAEGPLESPREF